LKLSICLLICLVLLLGVSAVAAPPVPAYHLIRTIHVGGDGGWDYLAFDGTSSRLFISRGTHVSVVDTTKDAVVGDIPNTPGVHGIAIARGIHRGFTSNGRENTVTIFNLDTLKEIDRVKVGKNPDAIIYDRASSRVFTFNGGSENATAIDAATGKVLGSVELGGKPEYAVTDNSGTIFVNIEDKSQIVAFGSLDLTIKNRWSISPGEEPSGLAFDPTAHRLFSVCSNQKMVVIDSLNGRVIATPAIGKGPDAAAFDRKAGLAFSSNGQDGTLTVIREESSSKFAVVDTVQTKRGARTMALDTKTGNVYLATADFLPTPAGTTAEHHRPQIAPNSFVILVVGK
jgi:DNA-binding beta-propeller fold protein YncE